MHRTSTSSPKTTSPHRSGSYFGYANVTGSAHQAVAHLRVDTGMTEEQAWRQIDDAGQLWTARSAHVWTLDQSMLTGTGIALARSEPAAERLTVAARQLRAEQRRTTQRALDRRVGVMPRLSVTGCFEQLAG